jgi:ferrous iron transport protein A
MLLSHLATGTPAVVERLDASTSSVDADSLHRLAELGFLPGEPVRIVQRGPGGREPLAVMVGDTLFALRLVEAACIRVSTPAA